MRKKINRRGALRQVSFLMGGTAISPALIGILNSCQKTNASLGWKPEFFNNSQAKLVREIVEIIIPKTDTPGAREAGAHIFIDAFTKHCVPEAEQQIIPKGLVLLEKLSETLFNNEFLSLSLEEKNAVIKELAEDESNPEGQSFFQVIKKLTKTAYFNSEEGAKKALAYLDIPGDYIPCTDLEEGQKAWAL